MSSVASRSRRLLLFPESFEDGARGDQFDIWGAHQHTLSAALAEVETPWAVKTRPIKSAREDANH